MDLGKILLVLAVIATPVRSGFLAAGPGEASQNVTVEIPVGTIVGETASTQFDGTTYRFKQFLNTLRREPYR